METTSNQSETTTAYKRLVDGKLLIAKVISINDSQVIYYFTDTNKLIKENTNLFLSVFEKVKTHTIEIDDLINWVNENEAVFASSTKEDKRLSCTMNGIFIIRVKGEILFDTRSPRKAVDFYNRINF